MSNVRKYHIVIGSKSFFESQLTDLEDVEYQSFLELVRIFDLSKQNKISFEDYRTNFLVLKNDNYHGIVESAHDRLGALIEDLTEDDAEIFIHNPPRVLLEFLITQKEHKTIELIITEQQYTIKRQPENFKENMDIISEHIFGQRFAIDEISKSLWYLTTVERKKPYVIMLYGNSSLGKTELVREISQTFFEGKFLEKHLSMFKNNNYSDYFFGDSPNRRSIGYDLLERESNLIFFDEIDKCPEYFYSAFYTLFDNTVFKDSTYDVNVSGAVIVLTSNYLSEEEMKKYLGMPIFFRIDKFIHFDDFNSKTIHDIVLSEIQSREPEYKDKFTKDQIYAKVSPNIMATGENARTIKYKVQQVIEDLLFEEIKNLH
ncbi:AAA family ATPase [Ruminococcus sp.]|uniref:AAA family ATPase n=1 Tax=Ruminococcus sp. TaxID=41978 RepID=UPI002E77ACB7|nr:AAA family ATPase [Ruminococcus sp.]MEE1264356.1 AAA family ATPase [Ruminococcus sp.]